MMLCLRYRISILFAATLCAACSGSDRVLPTEREQFVHAYADAMYEREKGGDSVETQRRVDSVLNNSGFTEVEFKDKFNAYAQDPRFMREIFDSVQAIVARRAVAAKR